MNIIDWILIVVFAGSLVLGIIKGLLKQVFVIVGFLVVVFGTAVVAPYVQSWFTGIIPDENTRAIVGTVATVILLTVATSLLSWLIRKLVHRSKAIGALDRILGGVVSLVVAFLAVSVFVELILNTGDLFLPATKSLLKEPFEQSAVVQAVYGNNFFGRLIVNEIANKILDSLRPAEEALLNVVSHLV